MSRCSPFPPPGYVKSAPVELELSSKKEKRKHKDKKKKRKKSSATNGDLTVREDDRPQCKVTEECGQPNEKLGIDKLPSAAISKGAFQRLQAEIFVGEVLSNCNLPTGSTKEQRFKPGEGLSSRSTLAAERLQRDHHVLANGVTGTSSCQRLQEAKSMAEGLTDSGLATADKRSRSDNSRVMSNGVPVASSSKKPEQAQSSTFSNGVHSTKRKRLQADSSGDGLPPNSVLAADGKKSDGLQVGKPRLDLLSQASNSSRLQADNSDNLFTSKNGLPDFERPGKKLRADHSRLNVGTNGAGSVIGQTEKAKGREVPHHLLAKNGDLQDDKFRTYMQSNGLVGPNCSKMQRNSSSVSRPISDMRTTTIKCNEFEKSLQPCLSSLPANGLNEKVRSGYSMVSKCEQSGERLRGGKLLKADSTRGEVKAQDPRSTCKERPHTENSQHDTRVQDVKTDADKTCNPHNVLACNYELPDSRLQEDGLKNRVLSNGVLAGHEEETSQCRKVGISISSPAKGAVIDNNTAPPINASSTSKVLPDFEEKSMKEKLMKLRIPHPREVWTTTEDEGWLVSCKQQLHSKQGEKGKESQIQQVWAETVLLPAVNLNALPYVVPN